MRVKFYYYVVGYENFHELVNETSKKRAIAYARKQSKTLGIWVSVTRYNTYSDSYAPDAETIYKSGPTKKDIERVKREKGL